MKMKKFMNAPETVTDEELTGLGLAYSDILDVDDHLVISKDLADADRVTIVTYGGSGHEPAQAGFLGKGGLDIQAVGDIFAAPNGQLVFDAMKLADKGHGVLLLTLNYAGDQLAGKQAMKLANKIARNAPIAVQACKKAINEGLEVTTEEGEVIEEKLFGSCFETHDQKEGMGCFLSREKPKPKAVFTNN